jgi:hypothetical protein
METQRKRTAPQRNAEEEWITYNVLAFCNEETKNNSLIFLWKRASARAAKAAGKSERTAPPPKSVGASQVQKDVGGGGDFQRRKKFGVQVENFHWMISKSVFCAANF